MFKKVDELNLENRDLLIPIGPSRTGKGTLIAALQGIKIRLFNKKEDNVRKS